MSQPITCTEAGTPLDWTVHIAGHYQLLIRRMRSSDPYPYSVEPEEGRGESELVMCSNCICRSRRV